MRIVLYVRRRWDDEGAGEGCLFILLDILLAYHVIYYSCIPLSPGLKVGLEELQDSAVLPLLSLRTLRTMAEGVGLVVMVMAERSRLGFASSCGFAFALTSPKHLGVA